MSLRKKWGKYEKASTITWGANWSYMRMQQDMANKWDKNETTPIHVVYGTTTYKTWDINCNIPVLKY